MAASDWHVLAFYSDQVEVELLLSCKPLKLAEA